MQAKALLCGLSVGIGILCFSSHAALLSYEPFDYLVGTDITGGSLNGGTGWGGTWGVNSGGATIAGNTPGDTIVSGNLGYTDSLGNSLMTLGNSGFFSGLPGTSQPFRDLGAARGADGTTTWISFVGVRLGPTTNNAAEPDNPYPRAANFSLYNAGSERLALGNSTGATNDAWSLIPLGGLGNRVASSTPMANQSLVVVRIDHIGDSTVNDNAYLFINPTLGVEPDISLASAASVGLFDYTITRVRPFAGNQQATRPYAEAQFDEFRLGETWADVTPFTPVPEPSTWALVALGCAGFFWLRRRKV
jgi:hypothetical protein